MLKLQQEMKYIQENCQLIVFHIEMFPMRILIICGNVVLQDCQGGGCCWSPYLWHKEENFQSLYLFMKRKNCSEYEAK